MQKKEALRQSIKLQSKVLALYLMVLTPPIVVGILIEAGIYLTVFIVVATAAGLLSFTEAVVKDYRILVRQ